jgi:hypothetical protein
LANGRWSVIGLHDARVVAFVDGATPGSFAEVEMPETPDPAPS